MKTNKKKYPLAITLLPFLAMLSVTMLQIYLNIEVREVVKIAILSLVLTGTISFYILFNMETLLVKRLAKTVIILPFLGAMVSLFILPSPDLYCVWMLCGLLISMLLDQKLGLLSNLVLTFLLGFYVNLNPERMLQLLFISVLLTVLSGAIKNKTTIVYAVIIILSLNTTLAFVMNNFSINQEANYDYVRSLFSVLAVILLGYLISYCYHRCFPEAGTEEITPIIEQSQEEDVSGLQKQEYAITKELVKESLTELSGNEMQKESAYEDLLNSEHELLMKLKSHSMKLYAHSLLIGELSGQAAKLIGAQEQLAMAGGLYHEIGKINGNNYIDEGLKLAQDYGFSEDLMSIIREHNIKYARPNSKEAAIVMLSDNVVSTIDYIEQSKDQKYTKDKVIDNLFQMRLDKGTFDDSHLSVHEFKQLKTFYLEKLGHKE